MKDFERGIRRAVAIYTAGINGATVPYFPGMRVSDIDELYTAGYIRAVEEVETAWDQSHPEAALREANEATYIASRAPLNRQAKWPKV